MKSVYRIFLFVGSFIIFSEIVAQGGSFETPYEKSKYVATASYEETISWYKSIQKKYNSQTELFSIGKSDAGRDIYVFHCKPIATEGINNRKAVKVLINNNIHPGEPEGTDACMLLVRDLLLDVKRFEIPRAQVDLFIVLQYNVDGTVRRNAFSRANQNGPIEYGFRATANNLDLNRDFIKCDSKNTQALEQFVTQNQIDFFIDNHTSNGADYQYALTYFHTVPEKLPQIMVPTMLRIDTALKAALLEQGWPTVPYVNTIQEVPDSGLTAFYESPRFATGWAATHGIIGFTVETHMLKPFHVRVDATKVFLEEFLFVISRKGILNSNDINFSQLPVRKQYIQFKLDKTKYDIVPFLGYEFGYKPSGISAQPRLFYDRNKPKTIPVKYYHHFIPTDSVMLPRYYIIPSSRTEIVERLRWNGVKTKLIQADSFWDLKVSYIEGYQTVKEPYEGHYLHYDVKTRDTVLRMKIYKGDWLINVGPFKYHFLSAVLEPKAPDSYFCWNFFDDVLQQKEGYSAYVFEDLAAEFLANHEDVKRLLAEKKLKDPEFAKNGAAQLDFVYKHSPYYESSHRMYPIYRSIR